MSVAIRTALRYSLGILPPVAFAQLWPGPEAVTPFAVYLFFLCIAASARYLGFGPALACIVSSAAMLWDVVLTVTLHPPVIQILRLILFLGASAFIASVTRHKSKETREAEDRLRGLFDNAIDAIMFFDSTGRYVDVNSAAAKLYGLSREEFLRSRLGDFSRPEDMRGVGPLMRTLMEEGSLDGEWTVVRKDGAIRETAYRAVANVLPGLHCVISHDITERKAAERSLRQLSQRFVHLQDDERRRIARQLHETTAQTLAAMRLSLTRLARATPDSPAREIVDESVALADQAIAEVRTISYLLHPPMIEHAGLLPALRWYVRGFAKRSGIAATLEAPEELGRLSEEIETTLFRIIQEALTNIQRHSGSPTARIFLNRQNGTVRLQVEDEGRGLPEELRSNANALRASGVGIAGIEQRVQEFGGQMEIESHDGGTKLRVTLPVERV